jgi:hypothetical protein
LLDEDPQAVTSNARTPNEATTCAFLIAAGYPFRDKKSYVADVRARSATFTPTGVSAL